MSQSIPSVMMGRPPPLPYLLSLSLAIFVQRVRTEIAASADLNCDFSSSCRWRNGTNGQEDNADFVAGQNLEMDEFHRITALRPDQDDYFVYTSAFAGRQEAMLVSDVVNCQLGGATLKFWYWRTGKDVLLDVCIRMPPSNKERAELKCYDGLSNTFAQQWIFRVIELPPISQPFELIFRATFNAPLDIIAVDNIAYDAILCEISNGGSSEGAGGRFDSTDNSVSSIGTLGQYSSSIDEAPPPTRTPVSYDPNAGLRPGIAPPPPPPPTPTYRYVVQGGRNFQPTNHAPRVGAQFESLCPAIDCNFDQNASNFCRYVTSTADSDLILAPPTSGKQREFGLSTSQVANSLTGVPNDLMKKGGFFAYAANAEHSSDQFVLSTTSPVAIPPSARVDFFIYLAGVHGRFRVCLDTLTNCPFTLSGRDLDVNSRQWKNYYVQLPEGIHAIHFVADQLKANYAIGIDNIQLLNRYGMSALACR